LRQAREKKIESITRPLSPKIVRSPLVPVILEKGSAFMFGDSLNINKNNKNNYGDISNKLKNIFKKRL